MPKKKGPPYSLEELDCKYIVVENPWPAGHYGPTGPARNEAFYHEVGAWLRYALNKEEYPETIYSRNTRAEIIVKFAQRVDIKPLLGSHYWPSFHRSAIGRQDITYVFEFNYVKNGHPETHNWAIHELDACDPPDWRGHVPFKQPYPPPTWADVRQPMVSSKDIALPIPVPPEEPFLPPEQEVQPKPKPDARQSAPLPIESSSVYSFVNDMRERVPKVEENTNLPRVQRREAPSNNPQRAPTQDNVINVERSVDPRRRSSTVTSRDGDKVDPYEQEAAAAQVLKAEPEDERFPSSQRPATQTANIKTESQGPSPELMAAFNKLQQSRQGSTAGPANPVKVKDEGPSPELMAAMNAYNRSRHGSTASVKAEPSERASSSSSSRYTSSQYGREHTASRDFSSNAAHLPPRPLTSGPSYGDRSRDPPSGTYDPLRREMPLKRESDGGWDMGAKRQKR